ncbi:unnamed protein product [Cladocopium goreaui]|uniref:Uncharacterized protein n=1 Tax=Cladocopium goreaui TaxID=2562237 RepID=A0A9P1BZF8_9DINO|nr:unnamed protein product [Cladocopium goreaui]
MAKQRQSARLMDSKLRFWSSGAKMDRVQRTLFHELRDPHPVALTINQRADWPLTDLKQVPIVHSVVAMNSLELTQHAERLCARPSVARGQPSGDWDAILARFALLASDMDADLSIRLLRCLGRAQFDDAALPQLVRDLPIEGKPPSNLTCWSSALLELHDRLGDEELQKVFQRIEHAALQFSEETWGLSAPMMLVSLVRASSTSSKLLWGPSCNLFVGAIARHAARMGPMHLEISAFSCSRVFRFSAKNPQASEKIAEAAKVLLEHGTRRVSRFVPRGMLNFYVALERILGPLQVAGLALQVARRLQQCVPGDLEGCSAGDRYRATLCLLRACEIDVAETRQHVPEALKLLLDGDGRRKFSPHGRDAIRRRLKACFGELKHLQDLLDQTEEMECAVSTKKNRALCVATPVDMN